MKLRVTITASALAVSSILSVACDPIEPGEEDATSVSATAENGEAGATGSENDLTGGEEVDIPELTVPSENSAKDKDMIARFSFATVCNSLFAASGVEGPSTVVTTDDNGATVFRDIEPDAPAEGGSAPVNCLEGPEISSQEAWDQLSGFLTTDMADCFANDNFWDHRKVNTENPTAACIEVADLNLNCNMYDLIDQMNHVKGIRPTLEGYHNMGWRVEQCGNTDDRFWLTLSTVIVAEGRHRYVGKVAEIQSLSDVCEGRSGGACLEAESQPDAKVLFVSSPFQIRENVTQSPAE